MPQTVLVIDDEPDQVKLLDYNLTQAGYLVLAARSGETGLALARRHAPEVIVLDVMMPGLDGWDVCQRLRRDTATSRIPIIMLTSKAEETDRVLGLELGADDYLTKPFSVRELLARVKALLRRMEAASHPARIAKAGPITVDSDRRSVTAAGKPVNLTMTEFDLLRALVTRPGHVLSRGDLIAKACGEDATVIDRTIDVHVAALRKKLERHGNIIETVRGVGYRFKE